MANDLFGNIGKMGGFGDALGGLMDGIAKSGLVPKDTTEGKLLAAQSELSDLQKQENEILLEIGRQARGTVPPAAKSLRRAHAFAELAALAKENPDITLI